MKNTLIGQPSDTTVSAVLDLYVADCFPNLAPRTRKDYVKHVRLLRELWGDRIVDEMRPFEFTAFIRQNKTGQVSRVRQLAVLSAAFSHAVSAYGTIERNPLKEVKRPIFRPRDRLVEQHEFDAVLAMAPPRQALGMRLALKTGQRQGDILKFRWDDIKDMHLEVAQGKTGKRLAIKIDAELESILDECWRLRRYNCEYVLGTRYGRQYAAEGYRASWQLLMNRYVRSGGRRFQFRDLRPMCATRMPTPEAARQLLGHTNIAMPLRVYRRGVERVDALPAVC